MSWVSGHLLNERQRAIVVLQALSFCRCLRCRYPPENPEWKRFAKRTHVAFTPVCFGASLVGLRPQGEAPDRARFSTLFVFFDPVKTPCYSALHPGFRRFFSPEFVPNSILFD